MIPEPEAKTHRISVTFRVDDGEPRTSPVMLIDGYSTPADIPKILAIRFVPDNDPNRITVLHTEEHQA